MLQIPQRLLSVRNKTYLLSPLPPRKRPISAQISRVTLGFVAIGSCLVMGYSAVVLVSLFKTPSKGELASNTSSGSSATLPPIASGAGSSPSPNLATPSQPLLPSTNANQRSNQVITGRTNPFTSIRELSVLLPGQVKWNKPKPLVKTPVVPPKRVVALAPQKSTIPQSKKPGLGLPPLPPQEIPATPTVPVPNFNPPSPESPGQQIPPPSVNPSGVNPVASTLACDVQINGVVQTSGEPMVVLKVKSEENAYPRVVQIGERICNGSVAVSQVIGLGGAQPTVVLDQYGQSIYKPVENTLVPPPKT